MTVSRALRPGPKKEISPDTVTRIQKIAEKLEYRPHTSARSLILRKTLNIGFCINSPSFSYYHSLLRPLFNALQKELQQHGYGLGYYFFDEGESPDFALFLKNLHVVDALIVQGRNLTPNQLRLIRESKIRAISLQDIHEGLYSVVEDDLSAGKAAADYLWSRGFRKVSLISLWAGDPDKSRWNGRTIGFQQRAAELNMEVRQIDNYWIRAPEYPEIWNMGHLAPDLTDQILDQGEAGRCVFTGSDLYGLGLLRQMKEKGLRLVDDISILSFDNVEGENPKMYPNPQLTTFHRPRAQIGRFIARLAIGQEDGPVNTPFIFPLSLIERGSVGWGPEAGR